MRKRHSSSSSSGRRRRPRPRPSLGLRSPSDAAAAAASASASASATTGTAGAWQAAEEEAALPAQQQCFNVTAYQKAAVRRWVHELGVSTRWGVDGAVGLLPAYAGDVSGVVLDQGGARRSSARAAEAAAAAQVGGRLWVHRQPDLQVRRPITTVRCENTDGSGGVRVLGVGGECDYASMTVRQRAAPVPIGATAAAGKEDGWAGEAEMHFLADPLRNGVLLGDLLVVLEPHASAHVKLHDKMVRQPKTVKQVQRNIGRALWLLRVRKCPPIPESCLDGDKVIEDIARGDTTRIWALLWEMMQAYPSVVEETDLALGPLQATWPVRPGQLPYTRVARQCLEQSLIGWMHDTGVLAKVWGEVLPTTLFDIEPVLRDGTLLCELCRVVVHQVVPGFLPRPRTKRAALNNLSKALDVLRHEPRMGRRHLYIGVEGEIADANWAAIYGVLEDMHILYDGMPPKPPMPLGPELPYCGGRRTVKIHINDPRAATMVEETYGEQRKMHSKEPGDEQAAVPGANAARTGVTTSRQYTDLHAGTTNLGPSPSATTTLGASPQLIAAARKPAHVPTPEEQRRDLRPRNVSDAYRPSTWGPPWHTTAAATAERPQPGDGDQRTNDSMLRAPPGTADASDLFHASLTPGAKDLRPQPMQAWAQQPQQHQQQQQPYFAGGVDGLEHGQNVDALENAAQVAAVARGNQLERVDIEDVQFPQSRVVRHVPSVGAATPPNLNATASAAAAAPANAFEQSRVLRATPPYSYHGTRPPPTTDLPERHQAAQFVLREPSMVMGQDTPPPANPAFSDQQPPYAQQPVMYPPRAAPTTRAGQTHYHHYHHHHHGGGQSHDRAISSTNLSSSNAGRRQTSRRDTTTYTPMSTTTAAASPAMASFEALALEQRRKRVVSLVDWMASLHVGLKQPSALHTATAPEFASGVVLCRLIDNLMPSTHQGLQGVERFPKTRAQCIHNIRIVLKTLSRFASISIALLNSEEKILAGDTRTIVNLLSAIKKVGRTGW